MLHTHNPSPHEGDGQDITIKVCAKLTLCSQINFFKISALIYLSPHHILEKFLCILLIHTAQKRTIEQQF